MSTLIIITKKPHIFRYAVSFIIRRCVEQIATRFVPHARNDV